MLQRLTTLLSLFCSLLTFTVYAQTGGKMPDFYKEPGLYPNREYTNQHFGEHIDPFTGALQLHYTDIFVPGNGGFNLAIQRSYNSASVDKSQPKHNSLMGVGWSLHFGRVTKAGAGGICTNDDWATSTDNPVLEMPDGSTQRLHFVATGSPLMLTTRRWKAECAPAATPGLIIYSTDGTQYLMTKQISEGGFAGAVNAYYTTKITDRNGNNATVSYSGNTSAAEITGITTSDGRSVSFTYADSNTAWRRITAITGPAGTWNYGYTAAPGLVNTYQLTSVTRPVSGNWSYSYNGNTAPAAGSYQMSSLTMPQGGAITYGYTNVSVDSASGTSVSMITSKNAGASWTWSYSPGSSGNQDTTTVNTPVGTRVYKHWGPNGVGSGDVWKIGLLMSKSLGSAQTETYAWDKLFVVDEPNWRDGAFLSKQDNDTFQPVLTNKTIIRGGATYSTTYSGFDSYGNPSSIVESGPNGGSRTTSATYFTDASKWIIGFIKNESRNGGQDVARSYDSNGNMTGISRDGVSYSYSYNSNGTVSQMTNPRGYSTSYGSYYRGTPQSETRPAGVGVSRNVSSAGNITSESVGGQSFGYGYDDINRVTSITYPTGSGVSISYGSASKTATRGGLTESTSYNGYGYVTGVTLGGIGRSYDVDALGRRTSESNPGSPSLTTDYTYDILGRVKSITNQDGTSRSISYSGNSATVQDERNVNTTYDYRSYGDPSFQALVSISSPLQATTINRNDRDLISSVTQGSKTRTYGYNGAFYVTSVTDPETGTTTYGRDAMGNMTSRKVGSSGTTSYGYDGQDRMDSATYPGGISISKTYNGRGRLLSVTGGDGDRIYTYDANDNLATEKVTVDSQTMTATYDYNALDQLESITYPKTGRTVSYTPNALGRPSKVGIYVTGVTYHSSGQVNTITYANGATTSYGQNSRLWPSSFTSSKSGAFISSTYNYDGVGNLSTISDSVDNSLDRTLGYDSIGRLTSAAGSWGTGTFVYDGAGNITSRTYGGVSSTYTYDGSNRLGSTAGQRNAIFSYDDYGNVTSDWNNSYTYNGVPNLTCVNCGAPPQKIEYGYDGTNTRVKRVKGGITTYQFHDAKGNLLLEYSPNDNDKTVEHIYLGNKRVAQRVNDTTVPKLATSTNLTANPTSATCNSSTALRATVSPSVATGTVDFLDGGVSVGTASLVNGVATLTLALPRPGSRSISARYQGDSFYSGSQSSNVAVNVASVANAVTLAYSPSPPYLPGNPLTITASVSGCVQGNGSITFQTVSAGSISSIPTATRALAGRVATYTLSPGLGRNYQFRATLSGDSIATNNIYADGQFDVLYNAPLTMSASPNPVASNAVTQLSAVLTSSNPGSAPTGNVVFKQGSTTLGSAYVSGAVPVQPVVYNLTVPWTPNIYPITASFAGDSIHYASVSAPYNLTVGPGTTTSIGAAPSSFIYGQNTTLTATVTSSSETPTGSVSFYDGSTLLGTQALSAGVATFNTTALAAGSRLVSAVYAGNGSVGGSTSSAFTITVAKATPSVTITSINPSPTTAFAYTIIAATVSGTPVPPPQFGQLLVNDGAIDVMEGSAGTLSRTTNRIPTGSWQVVARYPATANFNQADSAPVSLIVSGSACNVDVNRSTVFDEPDGRAIVAWLLGVRGEALYDASQNSNSVDAMGIHTFLQPQVADLTLDLDGDGKVLASTDGLMLLRIALGLTGTAVTSNAINPVGSRPDWASVKNYLNATCGMSLQ